MVSTILYHGSTELVKEPKYGKGRLYNDYGKGFYCTKEQCMAMEWASSPYTVGYAIRYNLEDEGLKILRLQDYGILTWLTILFENRTFQDSSSLVSEAKEYLKNEFSIPYKDYDIIEGYRADDSYFSFANDFLSGTISLQELSKAMKLGKLGMQTVLKSKRAFESIHYLDYVEVKDEVWYRRKMLRDVDVRSSYFNSHVHKREKGDIYIIHILDEEMKKDDPRLQ